MKHIFSILAFCIFTCSAWPALGQQNEDEHRPPLPPPRHEIQVCLEQLRTSDPVTFNHLMDLHRENRRAFMQEISALLQKTSQQENMNFHRAMQKLERKCWNIAQEIQNLPAGADSSALEKQLNDMVEDSINLAILGTRRRIEELEQKVKNIENDRENIKKQRVEFFLSVPKK